jgi:hypothetical protein
MKRVVVGIIVFGLFIALVFGLVLITELTGGEDPATANQTNADGKVPVGAPFVFPNSICRFDPQSEELQNRMFRGFYEIGETDTAFFWFKNRSPRPVTITSLGASCTTCSSARITHVAPESLTEYAKKIAISGMLGSLLPGAPNLIDAFALQQFEAELPWKVIDLHKQNSTLELPAGGTIQQPGLGIVQLQLKASAGGARDPRVRITAGVDDEPPTTYELQMNFVVVGNFAVRPQENDVGELAEGTTPRPLEIICWSATRDYGDRFPPPLLRPHDDDPFVTITSPVRLTSDELEKLNAQLTAELKGPNRCLAAYRYWVTVNREINGKVADIGPFTKTIYVAGSHGEKASITVKGSVTGVIRLAEGKSVDFGTYEARFDKVLRTTLISDRKDIDLEVVSSETRPRFLKATLDQPTVEGGAKIWKLNLKVNANEGFQSNWTGVVVLRSTGPKPITIRVPVTGNGVRR